MSAGARSLLEQLLAARLDRPGQDFLGAATQEIAGVVTPRRLAQLLALASRHARSGDLLAPATERLAQARRAGFNPGGWSVLEALRVALLLAWPRLDDDGFRDAFAQCMRFADHGEQCALYRSLPLLANGERFAVYAAEGCRSNMRSVFEAVACDSPYPSRHLDDIAWRQLAIKAVFIGTPLWRVECLDERLSPELARMALDLADERRSAGRPVPPPLWLCLGRYGGERALAALQRELDHGAAYGRAAALLALARAGDFRRALAWDGDAQARRLAGAAGLDQGDSTQEAFGRLSAYFPG